jgi:hypothetical protein
MIAHLSCSFRRTAIATSVYACARQGAVVVDQLPFVFDFIVYPARAAVHELLYTLT